ncbi:MAG: cytochrome c biogenesis protein CcsA [Flavobacteriaceae bacterium]|nr:cytochrome c biogenesis protein CcsA [Flavobacteriaceae bacterium]
MGVATFIENDFGTQTSKALVYNTWWFEAIMLFFVINFFGNIFRYRLYKKEKWAVLLFHTSFLLILIGAGVTRYIGYEGIMVIEEGEMTNKFLTETTYVNIVIDDGKQQKPTINEPILLSGWGSNSWSYSTKFMGQEVDIKLVDYIPWAEQKFIEDETGDDYLFLVESSSGSRHEHYIKKGTVQNIHNILVGFDAPDTATINITSSGDYLKIKAGADGTFMRMADQFKGTVTKDSIQEFQLRSLYTISGLPFVVPNPVTRGIMTTVRGPKNDRDLSSDLIILEVTTNNKTERIELTGGKYNALNSKQLTVDNLNFRLLYGANTLETPFHVKLRDFQLEKYPGSESAASYASEVTVISPEKTFDYRIYMNHILDYKGYKLFQSSYDISGEKEETHLSVNHDYWGTLITYIGYFLLYFGLICILFVKGTRFDSLKQSLKKIRKKKAALSIIAFLLLSVTVSAQEQHQQHAISPQQIDSILKANIVDVKHAELFNSLVIQDAGGRMKPAHTFASELVRKVTHQETFKGMNPSQVLLSIIENPRFWIEVPMIYLEKNNTKIREQLGLAKDATHARLSDLLTQKGEYLIRAQVAEAQKNNVKNKFEKDLINIDKRVGLLYGAIGGTIFKIFPVPNDPNNKWVSQLETLHAGFKGTDSVFVRQVLPVYKQILQKAKVSNDYTQADKVLDGIKNFQKKFGAKVIPSEDKIALEIAYNEFSIFSRLAKYFGFAGVLLIFVVIAQIFSDKKIFNYIIKGLIAIIITLFVFHTLGLVARWYISGNAPWSNAYESIIYVAWATMLFGLIFGRRSSLTIAATTFLTAVILAFAHQNWLDPEIANLQPVLNSWWLLVHVSIIVASYGPFSLGMILGIFSLFLMAFTNKNNKKKLDLAIKELTVINEMSITIGLIMLTIGNFLGGMWANESWGRYWGWDPKETWALISIMLYAFVLHMRLIPGLRSRFTFNLWSIIIYSSIMMTYFGVNFYLSGLHSYASGDKVITPTSVYYSLGFVTILGLAAWFKHKKYYKK